MNILRIASAFAGFTLALISIALNDTQLGWAAISLLLVSLIARLILRKRADAGSNTTDSDPGSPL